jgi:hypothetical protein
MAAIHMKTAGDLESSQYLSGKATAAIIDLKTFKAELITLQE